MTKSPEAVQTPEIPQPKATASPVAPSDRAALEEDYEDAEGLPGYDEVLALQVPLPASDSLSQGRKLYETSCASCHGDGGLGDGQAGESLDPSPRNLTLPDDYKYGHLELALYRTAAFGVPDTGMTGWGEVLEPKEIWAIGHYIRTLQK